jgi:hypothetical protein
MWSVGREESDGAEIDYFNRGRRVDKGKVTFEGIVE